MTLSAIKTVQTQVPDHQSIFCVLKLKVLIVLANFFKDNNEVRGVGLSTRK